MMGSGAGAEQGCAMLCRYEINASRSMGPPTFPLAFRKTLKPSPPAAMKLLAVRVIAAASLRGVLAHHDALRREPELRGWFADVFAGASAENPDRTGTC
jgi:hypothetical protein